MKEMICNSPFFGITISLVGYVLGTYIKKKYNNALLNPLLLSVLFVIGILCIFHIDYSDYSEGASFLSLLLTPATICLAIPMYEKIKLLRQNRVAIIAGIVSGSFACLISVLLFATLFRFNHTQYVTLLPKSVTAAIGMNISEELGGISSITIAAIIISGITGNVAAEILFKLAKIEEPVAKGVAIGTASHVIGTAKAMELGHTEEAISSLSIVVAGLVTVLGAILFSGFIR